MAKHGTSAALEYPVKVLKVAHIVIMGHAMCGGMRAYVETQSGEDVKLAPGNFIGQWISLLGTAAAKIGPRTGPAAYAEELGRADHRSRQLGPFLTSARRRRRGNSLCRALFRRLRRRLWLDAASGEFLPLAEKAHAAALKTPRF